MFSGINWDLVPKNDIRIGGQTEKFAEAIKEGFFSQPEKGVPGLHVNMGETGNLNAGHIFGMDALNCRSLSDGMIKGRKMIQEYAEFYRKYMGIRGLHLVSTAALMGVRESRRILGEYVLDYEDYKNRRQFPDQIAVYSNAVDIHPYDVSEAQYRRYSDEIGKTDRYEPGEYYGIPYGVLIPKGSKNLWTAGRCVSADVKVNGSIRVMPAAFMMGQAAGVAAFLSAGSGKKAVELNTAELVETLRNQGANLPQKELSERMTVKS
jgi:hypothetical protein